MSWHSVLQCSGTQCCSVLALSAAVQCLSSGCSQCTVCTVLLPATAAASKPVCPGTQLVLLYQHDSTPRTQSFRFMFLSPRHSKFAQSHLPHGPPLNTMKLFWGSGGRYKPLQMLCFWKTHDWGSLAHNASCIIHHTSGFKDRKLEFTCTDFWFTAPQYLQESLSL